MLYTIINLYDVLREDQQITAAEDQTVEEFSTDPYYWLYGGGKNGG